MLFSLVFLKYLYMNKLVLYVQYTGRIFTESEDRPLFTELISADDFLKF